MRDWKMTTIAECSTILGDGLHGTPKYDENGEYAFINGNNLHNGRIVIKPDTKRVGLSEYEKHKKELTDRTVLVSINGTLGNVAVYNGEKVILGKSACYFNVSSDCDVQFMRYVASSPCFQQYINSVATGTTIKNVSLKQMREYSFLIPELEEQQRIAKVLHLLDQKIENNQKINNNLEQQASVLVRQYCESLTSSVELGTVLSFENGFAFQSSSYHEKGKYRIITIKNVQDGRIDAQGAACIDDIPPRMKQGCFLTIGDVLLSLTGNVGRVGIVCENDLLLNQRVAKFIPKDIRTLPLLYFYFRLPSTKISLETISKGTAQQNLSPIETLKLEIPYETQQALKLSNLLQPIFDIIYQKNIENIQLAEIRDSLLPKLMSGELDVSDIDL